MLGWPMEYWVYILRSVRTGRMYIGHTRNLERRLAEHNKGNGCTYTRGRGPWVLAYSEGHADRSSASRRERFLKSVEGSREKKRLAGMKGEGSSARKLGDAHSGRGVAQLG